MQEYPLNQQEAYLTAVCIGDSDGVLDCLRQLLQRTVQLKKPDEFNRLPFVGTVVREWVRV